MYWNCFLKDMIKSKLLFVLLSLYVGFYIYVLNLYIYIYICLDWIFWYTARCCYLICTTFWGDCRCSLIYQKSLISILMVFIVQAVSVLSCIFGLHMICSSHTIQDYSTHGQRSNYSSFYFYARVKSYFLLKSVWRSRNWASLPTAPSTNSNMCKLLRWES